MKTDGLVELRVYSLKPGTRAACRQRFSEQVLPMLVEADALRFGLAE